MNPQRVLVTGANGFVGRALVAELLRRDIGATVALRDQAAAAAESGGTSAGLRRATVGDIGPLTDWGDALAGADAVVHLAARVHVMREQAADPLAAFRAVNVLGTERLARAAAAAGVRRFVFVSSVKVNGEATAPGAAFRESDPPSPQDAYGQSKWEAEQALQRVAAQTGLEVVVVRPPLVYGPGVGANFRRLLRLVNTGVPLPFASVRNRRSMVFVGNLVDALVACATQAQAAGRTFFVSDGDDLATPELIRRMAAALGRRTHLWPCPPRLLDAFGMALGRRQEMQRLLDSLAVNSDLLRATLAWRPPFSVAEGLAQTAAWYRTDRQA